MIQGSGTIERSAFCIHAAIHIRHPAAKCVLHAHPPYSTWLADVEDGRLRMTNQDIIRFHDRVAYNDGYEGADNEVGEQFATSAVLYFDALKRELDRENPGYTA